MSDTAVSPVTEPALYDCERAARQLSISRRTVWNLIASGALKAKRIGRMIRIPRTEIEKFARGGDVEPPTRKRKKKQ